MQRCHVRWTNVLISYQSGLVSYITAQSAQSDGKQAEPEVKASYIDEPKLIISLTGFGPERNLSQQQAG